MRRSLFVSLTIAAVLALAWGAVLVANHSWGSYHWARTSNPFTLQLGDNVHSGWDAHLATASSHWSQSTVLGTTIVAGGTRPRNCKPTSGRIEVCADRYGFNGWLGLAQIWISGVHITQAITKLNDSYFNTSTYNKREWRQMVMCQEVGHDFGLDHQDEDFGNSNVGSCMDYTNNPLGPPSNEQPNQHDYDQLVTIYAHTTDGTTTVDQTPSSTMPPAMGQIDFETPAQWGRLVWSSRNGRAQIYELDFGRGFKVITRVLWADPRGDAR